MTARSVAPAGPVPRAITSLQNDRVKLVRSLELRKTRRESGLFAAEGQSVIVSARDAGWTPRMLLYRAGSEGQGRAAELIAWALAAGAEVLEVSEAVQAKLAAKDNPQNLLAVFEQRWAAPPVGAGLAPAATWLALEEVRDPGNLGTSVRTADAVGAAGVLLVGTCCDAWSRECVRATMGSIFSVPLVRLGRDEFIALAAAWPGDRVATHLDADADFRRVAYRGPTLLVMGSEGPGLTPETLAACSRRVRIPMAGRLDSLNLAVATALALYQVRGPWL